jgi:hypothetical protein
MRRYERFVLSPLGANPGNEYRITGGRVEFRSFHNGNGQLRKNGVWRALAPNDILMHLSLNTEVGKWLVRRLQNRFVA